MLLTSLDFGLGRCDAHPPFPAEARKGSRHKGNLGGDLKGELNDVADGVDVRLGEVEREPEVGGVLDVLVARLAVRGWEGELPGLEVPGVVGRSEDLHGHAALGALLAEGVGLVPVPVLEVELEGVAHSGGSVEGAWEPDSLELAQPPLGNGVVVPVLLVPVLEQGQLGLDDRRGDLVHPQGVVGGLELELLEELVVLWGREVGLVEVLVRPGAKDGPDGDLLVVGHQESALSRVDELVGLGGEARGDGSVLGGSGLDALPVAPEGVGAVLDEGDVVLLAHLGDPGHVTQPSPHVGHDGDLGPGLLGLPLEVLDVDDELVGAVHVLGLAAGVHDGGRHRGKGERVGQDLGGPRDLGQALVLLLEDGEDGEEDGTSARVERHAVLVSGDVREGLLHEGDVIDGLVWVVGPGGQASVPEHPSGLHDLATPLDPGLGHGTRGLDVDGKPGLHGVLVVHRVARQGGLLDHDVLGAREVVLWDPCHEGWAEPGVLPRSRKGEPELPGLLLHLAAVLAQLRSTKSRHTCWCSVVVSVESFSRSCRSASSLSSLSDLHALLPHGF
mmetsp:Transcript_419/g.1657  ORF Transcript_419/g.1657 Transcript_419/m.1657 type:complete len:558 (+) Transcript_419:221-1894(+)